ncbi:hypothetical protein LCGC14_2328710, partial [marine sediment metagenome]
SNDDKLQETASDTYCERHNRYLIEMLRNGNYAGEYCPECDRESRED